MRRGARKRDQFHSADGFNQKDRAPARLNKRREKTEACMVCLQTSTLVGARPGASSFLLALA